ncbi:MAG: hypothetical protein JOY71_11215 [Acetobacteraceae bacterium]|nr:hypothetical protein [Acetobacteraceae bacterium]MBV8522673.1 hypothetical protein [Acetobacteraceae bacterium]
MPVTSNVKHGHGDMGRRLPITVSHRNALVGLAPYGVTTTFPTTFRAAISRSACVACSSE